MKKNAFTLAETLITLIIIGVVAALTIPTIMSHIELQKNISIYRNTVADLNKVIGKMKLDNDDREIDPRIKSPDGNWSSDSMHDYYLAKYFKDYFTDSTLVGYIDNNSPDAPYLLDGSKPTSPSREANMSRYRLRLNNGVSLYFASGAWNYNILWIDTNGEKLPNRLGKDVYRYTITDQRLIPDTDSNPCKLNVATTGYSCSVRFLSSTKYED